MIIMKLGGWKDLQMLAALKYCTCTQWKRNTFEQVNHKYIASKKRTLC